LGTPCLYWNADPKSIILHVGYVSRLFMSMFSGFRSQWMKPYELRSFIPEAIWVNSLEKFFLLANPSKNLENFIYINIGLLNILFHLCEKHLEYHK
jgi:hypothetical protein